MQRAFFADHDISLKNIYLHNYLIIFAKNCNIEFSTRKIKKTFNKGNVIFMKKNIMVNVRTQRVSPGKLYESVTITAEELQKAKRIIEEVCTIDYFIRNNTERNEIISIQPKDEDEKLVDTLFNKNKDERFMISLFYLISKQNNFMEIALTFFTSSTITFSDKVKAIIQMDLTRKWKLTDIACSLNVSEITIRKNLERSGLTFNQLLLDLRMQEAFRYITK
ncbi:TPA: hypothetical protein ACIYP6_004792, partial [Escherichia coli]